MEEKVRRYEVHGKVTGRGGQALRGVRIVLWWQHIRNRRKLAVGETSDDGQYRLKYRIPKNAPRPILLIVEAISKRLDEPLHSPLTETQPDLEINLQVEPHDQSEWAKLVRSMEPLLEGLKLSELVEDKTHQDITFLARELGKDTETVMRAAVSARLEKAFKIAAPVLFAFLRQRVPAALPSPLLDASQNFTLIAALIQKIGSLIFALSTDIQKQTLTSAIALNIIGEQFTEQIPAILEQLQALRTADLLNQPYLTGNTTLAQLLQVADLPQRKQQAFAQALAASSQSMRNFWRTLGDGKHGFTAAEASAVERTLSVGAFVKNFMPLVQELVQRFAAGTYKNLQELAGLKLQDWVQIINETGAPPAIDASGQSTPAEVFATVIYTRVTNAYPTPALASRLGELAFVPPSQQRTLIQFFQNNLTLELTRDNLPVYLAAQGDKAFGDINVADRPVVVAHARSMQRVLRVAPNVDVTGTLLGMGVKSATQIANLGQKQFVAKATAAGLTRTEANQVFQVAAQRYANLVAWYTRFHSDAVGVLPNALGEISGLSGLAQQAIQRDQSLATLFGSQDYCETDSCTSVLSPAAYLCDLLLWLRNHPQGARTALDILNDRRPDIRHLLLNCPNTETVLPYIDLVNELLADKISPPIDGVSTTFTQESLIDGTTYYYIVTAVNAVGESAASMEVSATPAAPVAVPTAPAGITATPGDSNVTIGWGTVAGATSYNIYWANAPGVTTATGTKIPGVTSPYIQGGLVNGTTYYYIVTAANAVGESVASAQVSASPAAPVAVPAAPTGLAAVPGDTQITISWNAGPGATSYNIYWATSPGVTTATGTRITGATNPYIQTALVNGTTYYYIVTAVNALGESVASSGVSAAPAAPTTVPAAPTGLTATPGDGLVSISWNSVPGATSYNIYWATAAGVTTANGTEIMGSRNPRWKQTSANKTAAELKAAPEYFNQGAFITLFGASYPFILPYSAGLDVLRTCLQQWKLPLWQVRQALLPFAGGTTVQKAAVAAERFTIAPHGEDLITTPNLVPLSMAWNTANPATDLTPVPAFLQAATITYESLLELLQSTWVQGGLNIGIQGIDDTCMTSNQMLAPFSARTTLAAAITAAQTTIQVASDAGFPSPNFSIGIGSEVLLVTAAGGAGNTTWTVVRGQQGTAAAAAAAGAPVMPPPLDNGFLDRAHRFLMLWNSTGYKMWELDLLLNSPAVGNGTLDKNAMVELLSFRQLQDSTRLSVVQQIAFYQNIDTATHRDPDGTTTVSFYAQIFLNPAVTSVAPDADLNVLPSGGPVSDQRLSGHLPVIQAALGISAADATTLVGLTVPVATTLAAPIAPSDTSLTVASDAGFPAPSFFVSIGSEVLLVTAVGGVGNTTWTVVRGQKGTSAAPAASGDAIGFNPLTLANLSLLYRVNALALAAKLKISDLITIAELLSPAAANAMAALAPLFASPAATQAFLTQAKSAQQPGITLDALEYLLTPPVATTLTAAITAVQTTITVASDTSFPSPNFYITIGSEILQVTAAGGAGNTTWTVARGQQGTTAAAAGLGSSVGLTGGWVTVAQMTQANIAATLAACQQAVQSLPTTLTAAITAAQTTISVASDAQFPQPNFYVSIGSEILLVTAVGGTGNTTWTVVRGQQGTAAVAAANGASVTPVSASTSLAAPITAAQTSITVASDTGFPPPNVYVSIGSEILLVTAVGGVGNTSWTVVRGQQSSTASAAAAGAAVTPTGANLNGSVIAAVAANAHSGNNSGLANDVSAIILNTLQLQGTGQTLLSILTDPVFTGSANPITSANFPNQFLAIQLFDKAAVMVRGLRLVATDLTWLLGNAGIYGGLDFTQLPVVSGQAPLGLPPVLTTFLLVKLARKFNAAPPQSAVQTLYDVIGGVSSATLGTAAAAQAALATISGWPLEDIAAFAGALQLVFPANYTQPAAYDALRALESMAQAAGASGAQIVNWGTVPLDEASAESISSGALGVLKSQQASNDAWLTLASQLMNPIRERRSSALQAYLIGQRDMFGNLIYGDVNGLFNYFLIDIQMTSCQVTSRVVQAYIAVQIFVERCLMNLEAPAVVVNLNADDTWNQWDWIKRYRIWEANREVFLYPENWLIESQRPNRTEIYKKLEQEVRQGQSTRDYLETVVLNYIDRLDGLAHLLVTGTCEDPSTGDIHVVARTLADPPLFYLRSYTNGAWTGWTQIPLDIKAHQVIPALYLGRLCLFWPELKVINEPKQQLPTTQASTSPPPQDVERYVSLAVFFSIFRNGSWAPAQASKGKLFDKPLIDPNSASDVKSVEAFYTIKVKTPAPVAGYGANLWIDVFRFGDYNASQLALAETLQAQAAAMAAAAATAGGAVADLDNAIAQLDTIIAEAIEAEATAPTAVHVGRAVFDGRFNDLELNNLNIAIHGQVEQLLPWAQQTYGPDAQPLLPLAAADPDLVGEPNLLPAAGALQTTPASSTGGSSQVVPLNFTSAGAMEQNVGPLLNTAQLPFRVVGPDSDLNFDPTSYFFFQDNRRAYYVESQKKYWTGSMWSPVAPSSPGSVPFEVTYWFHVFYHPFTRLFWHQLAGGGFDLLYDPNLQQNPDQINPSGGDVFSFGTNYQPTWRVRWDHDDVNGQDRQFLDFTRNAPFSVYHWELFYHIPLYIAQLLSQNQQFEDAQKWFHYIFNPTRQGSDPVPQRFWIPKPLHNLTTGQILGEQINELLLAVNRGDPTAVAEVNNWRAHPLNPFLIADLRLGVPYMKSTVMSYLDNLIAWADNLFSSQSREALSEATLLYVTAAEILGPTPAAVPPPQHADESFDQLEPSLDAFANALVEIENVIGGAGGAGGVSGGGIPAPQTFYFKIPPNSKLLSYWTTVSGRLSKMRHCQTITGAPLELALFDAPIDPGLLIAAQAAGMDLASVLSNVFAPLPNYRFTALYSIASDFVGAVRTYGGALQAALEKVDAGALALLQQTLQQQLLADGNQILDWQIQQAQDDIVNLQQGVALAQQKFTFNSTQSFTNAGEDIELILNGTAIILNAISGVLDLVATAGHMTPSITLGAAGFGGTPIVAATWGGHNVGASSHSASNALKVIAAALEKGAAISGKIGSYQRRMDNWKEAATEAQIQIAQATAQLDKANIALQIAQLNQTLHQEQIDNIQKQIDFLNDKFTSNDLYDWMVGSLSATYFQSYQLAYLLCRQVERCYQFELGIPDSSFIQFGYWDSLHKGLLAGETLNHDLRRMQASYFQENARRYELSRYISLASLDPGALQQLLVTGVCDFTLPESLFANDYPKHYNRRLTRVSVTVVYPNPGKFDNVKATLTMTANKVRVSADTSAGYTENPVGSDPRFVYDYAAVPQEIALGNAQDDPGLFVTSIASNITDQRYLPFENAGAISSWHLEMQQINNEVDLSTVGDVVIHLFYTALDGGASFGQDVEADNLANQPSSGVKVFSAQNDFGAGTPTVDNPYPATPWQAFLGTQKAIINALPIQQDGTPRWQVFNNPPSAGGANTDQVLTLKISPLKFPAWTRGKTISVSAITVVVVAWEPGNFVLAPQAPLPAGTLVMNPVAGVTEPNVCAATIVTPAGTPLGTWSFKLQQQGAADFRSLTSSLLGDLFLLVNYDAV
ncbi:MAG TPA: neuraminidase-like domain-containing protein [Candidatus Angelobacter sp.]|nr:neuraminidase-like domain-containing protein [Candidatus Angelobacter sp.]